MNKISFLYIPFVLFYILSSCNNTEKNERSFNDIYGPYAELEYEFIDSLDIGRKEYNKVEVRRIRDLDSVYVQIILFEKNGQHWDTIQQIAEEVSVLPDTDVNIKDFNNDSYKDLTYRSTIAANGANEIRKLYIFDAEKNKLVYIRNSEDYPNLSYNEELDCIESYAVSGGTSTSFLKLDNDSLRKYACIAIWGGTRTIFAIDKQDKEVIIDESRVDDEDENFDLVYGGYDYIQLKEILDKFK